MLTLPNRLHVPPPSLSFFPILSLFFPPSPPLSISSPPLRPPSLLSRPLTRVQVPQGNTAAREKAELVAIHQRAEATKAKTEAADAEKTAKDRDEEVRLLILLTTTTTTTAKPKPVKRKAVHPEVRTC